MKRTAPKEHERLAPSSSGRLVVVSRPHTSKRGRLYWRRRRVRSY